MRIFKNAWFERFSHKQGIANTALLDAIARTQRGLIDADLGGGVIKQRVARSGQGKAGSFRSIILYRKEERAFLCTGSQRAIATASMVMKKSRSRRRRSMCSGYRKSSLPH